MGDDAKGKPNLALEHEAPKERFVRTFETDSATLKAGGKPDFISRDAIAMPVVVTPEDRLSQAVAAKAVDTIDVDMHAASPSTPPQPAPAFDPNRLGAIPETAGATASERLIGASTLSSIPALTADMMPIDMGQAASATSAAQLPGASAAPPVPERPKDAASSALHTYTSDFADAVETQGATSATILAAEQDAAAPQVPQEKHGYNIALILGAIVLMVLGAAGAYYAYVQLGKPTSVAVSPLTPARIFVDERQLVHGTGGTLTVAVEQSVEAPMAANTIRLLYTESGTSTGHSVFSALQMPAPDILLRNIDAASSLAGIVNVSGLQSPFFILAVQSYGDTFSGMLTWEPRMFASLLGLYPLYPATAPPPIMASTTATSTAPVRPVQSIPVGAFKDEVVANHDTRVLRDTTGRTLIIYGYWDQHTLVIARDETAFSEIIGRLANSRSTR